MEHKKIQTQPENPREREISNRYFYNGVFIPTIIGFAGVMGAFFLSINNQESNKRYKNDPSHYFNSQEYKGIVRSLDSLDTLVSRRWRVINEINELESFYKNPIFNKSVGEFYNHESALEVKARLEQEKNSAEEKMAELKNNKNFIKGQEEISDFYWESIVKSMKEPLASFLVGMGLMYGLSERAKRKRDEAVKEAQGGSE
ncbi:MAG: hypothetical protein WD876_02245 [Candidatus Pacearchaeota archaeon]